MKLRDLRRKVEKVYICTKAHERWDTQKICKHFVRSDVVQDQCDYCNSDGCCDYQPDEAA